MHEYNVILTSTLMNTLKKLYGQKYVNDFVSHQSPKRIRRLLQYISVKPDDKVVDFACGSAMLMEHIAPSVASYTGVDFSLPFIKAAIDNAHNKGFSNVHFEHSQISKFSENHKKEFDAAFAFDFSEHVDDRQWLSILKQIKKTLKPKATLYLHTPNRDFIVEILKEQNWLLSQLPEHIAVRTMKENIGLLQKAGYKTPNVKYLAHYNVLRFLHPLSHLPMIGKNFSARIFITAKNGE